MDPVRRGLVVVADVVVVAIVAAVVVVVFVAAVVVVVCHEKGREMKN